MTEIIVTVDATNAVTPRSTAGMTAPFASRTNRQMKPSMRMPMLHALILQRHRPLTLGARLARTPTWRVFRLLLATTRNTHASHDKIREDGTNTQVQEYISFPAMMEIGICTPPGDAAVFIDTAASYHMVSAESQLCQHVVNKIDCSVRAKGSCGLSSASSKGTLRFRLRNDRGESVPIHLEVLIVPNLGASVFSVGVLHEKGVKLNLLSNPPVMRDGNDTFPISTRVPRMFVLYILLDGQEEPYHIAHTAVDTDKWHRSMDPRRPHALNSSSGVYNKGECY